MVEVLGWYVRRLDIDVNVYHLNLREGLNGDVAMLRLNIQNCTKAGTSIFYGEAVIAVSSFAVPCVALWWSLTVEKEFEVAPGDVFVLDTLDFGRSSEWVSGSIFGMREEQYESLLIYIARDVWVRVKDLVPCEKGLVGRVLGFVHEVRFMYVD
jgi:hypothetical protein